MGRMEQAGSLRHLVRLQCEVQRSASSCSLTSRRRGEVIDVITSSSTTCHQQTEEYSVVSDGIEEEGEDHLTSTSIAEPRPPSANNAPLSTTVGIGTESGLLRTL